MSNKPGQEESKVKKETPAKNLKDIKGNQQYQSRVIIMKEVEELLRDVPKKQAIDFLNLFTIWHPYFFISLVFIFFMLYNHFYTDIFCAILLLGFQIIMVVFQLKRKRFTSEIYEIRLKKILNDYKEEKEVDDGYDPSEQNRLYKKTYESLDYCFTHVLRRKDGKSKYHSTPNVLLAKGDIIRMCCNHNAPANIVSISDPQLILNKGEIFTKNYLEPLDRCDIKAYFTDERGYNVFEVIETPIITELKQLFDNIDNEKDDKQKILFDQQKLIWKKIMNIVLMILFCLAFALSLTWITLKDVPFQVMLCHPIYMIIIMYYISVPTMLKIIDAWSNALMVSLSESLQKNDYNKQFANNYFQFLKKKEKKTRKKNNEGEGDDDKKKKKKSKRKNSKRNHVKGFIKVDTFYEEFNFDYHGFRHNWPSFKKMIIEGVSRKENYVGILSSATIVAFTDMEGIINENERYVNELAMFDKGCKKVVIDLLHDPYVDFDEDLYVLEQNKTDISEYNSLKKVLAASMGNSQNPEFGNKQEFMRPIFKIPNNIKQKVENNSGEYFLSRFNKHETTPHLDCMCALSSCLGSTIKERKGLFPLFSYWNIKKKTE